MKTTETVDAIVRKTVEALGFELCDVEFAKESGNWVLTLFINREGGVTIDDCEAVSHAVDPILDEADPIPQSYYLSVSSLGLDRPLKKAADFQRNLGKQIEVEVYAELENKKGTDFVLDQMKRMASNTAFIAKMQYEPHELGDVILITGVGQAFPFIRVHALLDAMQPYFSDVPVLVMYPGTFDGRYVKLFDKLTPNPYYRAFNVI